MPTGPAPNDRYSIPGGYLAGEHADLETGGQDIGKHHKRFFIHAFWNTMEAEIAMRDADVFRLCTVDKVTQLPAALV